MFLSDPRTISQKRLKVVLYQERLEMDQKGLKMVQKGLEMDQSGLKRMFLTKNTVSFCQKELLIRGVPFYLLYPFRAKLLTKKSYKFGR